VWLINRLMLSIFVVGSVVVTIAAVLLIGTTGLVLLILAGLAVTGLIFDQRLRQRAGSSTSAVPRTHIEANEASPLGANEQQHDDLRAIDFPPGTPAFQELRRREAQARRLP
jgi:hypothetical protein